MRGRYPPNRLWREGSAAASERWRLTWRLVLDLNFSRYTAAFVRPPGRPHTPHLAMEICREITIVDRRSTSNVELALPRLKPAGRDKQYDHHVVIKCFELLMSFSGTSRDSSCKGVEFLVRVYGPAQASGRRLRAFSSHTVH